MDRKVNHVGIILDGNRRFAKRLMMQPWKGHEWGAEKVKMLLEWAGELDIRTLTLYAFSMQNFNRPKKEFDYLMGIFKKEFSNLLQDSRVDEKRIRVKVIGRVHLLPKDVQEALRKVEEKTAEYDNFKLNFALAYGGQSEIVDAAVKLAEDIKAGKLDPKDVDEKLFANYLYMPDSPDLIIRTGGDRRTSNFLNYQSAYSEWFFLEKKWPEFEKEDLISVIDQFKQRERRFGH